MPVQPAPVKWLMYAPATAVQLDSGQNVYTARGVPGSRAPVTRSTEEQAVTSAMLANAVAKTTRISLLMSRSLTWGASPARGARAMAMLKGGHPRVRYCAKVPPSTFTCVKG